MIEEGDRCPECEIGFYEAWVRWKHESGVTTPLYAWFECNVCKHIPDDDPQGEEEWLN